MEHEIKYPTRKVNRRDYLTPIGLAAVWAGMVVACICTIVGAVTIGMYLITEVL